MSILSVPITIRSTQRLGQIASTLARHGFGHVVTRLKLRRYLPWHGKLRRGRIPTSPEERELTVGRRIVAICEELGPTFVKLAQLLSSRPDLISPELMEDLQALQDRVAAFPTDEAYKIIEEELGRPADDLFDEFDPVPLASGSIAQTYVATTGAGQRVVVKVRRPGIEQIIRLDMHILARLAEGLERYMPELRIQRPTAIVDEFTASINREMDLLNEATITERVHRFFQDEPSIVTPSVYWDLTSSKVLTLSYVTGRNFNEALADPELVLDRTRLARILIDAFMRQYVDLGVFHADPHPGNLLIIPPDKVGVVDFGMAGQIDRRRCGELVILLTACHYRQMDLVIDILEGMNALTPETDAELLKRDLSALLDKYQALPLKYMNFQTVFSEITSLAREHQTVLPRDFVMVGKSLVNVGGAALALDPDLNPNEVIRPRVRQAVLKLFNRENITREFALAAWHGGLLVKDMPRQIRELSRKALRGQLKFKMEHEQMDSLLRELDRSSNRLSFALVIAAIVIGSSLIFHARLPPFLFGSLPALGLIGYLVAVAMGLLLVIAIIRSGKLS